LKIVATVALVSLASACTADAADKMVGDGLGCKDRTIAGQLIGMPDTDPVYIEIWANGMQDFSCRGLGASTAVEVKDRDEEMACVLPLDDQTLVDEKCFWVVKEIAPPQ